MSFLSDIEVVTGYVLLGLLEVDTIPLVNLRLIRADNTYNIKNMEYGLIVAITSAGEPEDPDDEVVGLRELQLPSLKGMFKCCFFPRIFEGNSVRKTRI